VTKKASKVECLPSKLKALCSNPSTTKKKKKVEEIPNKQKQIYTDLKQREFNLQSYSLRWGRWEKIACTGVEGNWEGALDYSVS
jgi:hypothetical protein